MAVRFALSGGSTARQPLTSLLARVLPGIVARRDARPPSHPVHPLCPSRARVAVRILHDIEARGGEVLPASHACVVPSALLDGLAGARRAVRRQYSEVRRPQRGRRRPGQRCAGTEERPAGCGPGAPPGTRSDPWPNPVAELSQMGSDTAGQLSKACALCSTDHDEVACHHGRQEVDEGHDLPAPGR